MKGHDWMKRVFGILTVLCLLLCGMAFAESGDGAGETTDCTHRTVYLLYTDSTEHCYTCECGEKTYIKPHDFNPNGLCGYCGYACEHPDVVDGQCNVCKKCLHTEFVYTNQGKQHTYYCPKCDNHDGVITAWFEDHTFVDKVCVLCGACSHEGYDTYYAPDALDGHAIRCVNCDEKLKWEKHSFVNNVCVCGECKHEGLGEKFVYEGSVHGIYCAGCGEKLREEKHQFTDGICACGPCTHEDAGVKGNAIDTTSHIIFCANCGEELGEEEHTIENNVCSACGYCTHIDFGRYSKPISAESNMHITYCSNCNTIVAKSELHSFMNGVCTACGFCSHEGFDRTYAMLTGGNHQSYCANCKAYLGVSKHVFEDGVCACGARETPTVGDVGAPDQDVPIVGAVGEQSVGEQMVGILTEGERPVKTLIRVRKGEDGVGNATLTVSEERESGEMALGLKLQLLKSMTEEGIRSLTLKNDRKQFELNVEDPSAARTMLKEAGAIALILKMDKPDALSTEEEALLPAETYTVSGAIRLCALMNLQGSEVPVDADRIALTLRMKADEVGENPVVLFLAGDGTLTELTAVRIEDAESVMLETAYAGAGTYVLADQCEVEEVAAADSSDQ